MPIYEYQCVKCNERFEVLQSISADNSGLSCPKCGEQKPQKMMSQFASSADVGSSGSSCSAGSGFS